MGFGWKRLDRGLGLWEGEFVFVGIAGGRDVDRRVSGRFGVFRVGKRWRVMVR